MKRKLSAALAVAALSSLTVLAQAQTPSQPSGSWNSPAATPSSSGSGEQAMPQQGPGTGSSSTPADINPATTPQPGMQSSPSNNSNYGTSPSSASTPSTVAPSSSSFVGSTSSDTQRDPSAPRSREDVQNETLKAMRSGAIVQGEATPPELEQKQERAQHSLY